MVVQRAADLAGAHVAQRQRYLPAIARGQCFFGIGMSEPDSGSDLASVRTRGTRTDGGWRLSGEQAHVLDGAAADTLLVLATTETGTGLFAVEGTADGLTREPQSVLDLTRRQARLRYADVPARAVGEPGQATAAVAGARDVAAVVLAAEAVGGAVEETVARVGGGALPLADLPSFGCAVEEELAAPLRAHQPPVIAVVRDGRTLLDCRTLTDAEAAEVAAAVEAVNATVGPVEQIKKFTILPADFTQETGELTPTLKVKRQVVGQKYAEAIEALYVE